MEQESNNQGKNLSNQDIIGLLLEENNQLLQEVKDGNERLLRYLRWSRTWSGLRLLIILIPIILGILYFKPYAQNLFGTYQDLVDVSTNSRTNESLDTLEQLKQYKQVGN